MLASDSEPPEQNQLERLEEVAEDIVRPFLLVREPPGENPFVSDLTVRYRPFLLVREPPGENPFVSDLTVRYRPFLLVREPPRENPFVSDLTVGYCPFYRSEKTYL